MAARPTPLVDADWLAAHAAAPDVRLVDVRWYLAGKRGADEYARGHLPGAAFVDLDRDLAAPAGAGPGRHPLPPAEAFAETLSRLGVRHTSIVVGYDDAGGAIAARLWWLLRHFGHDIGRVLDGGIGAWIARGHPLTTDVARIDPAPKLRLVARTDDVVDARAVDALRSDPSARILDARAPERYEGASEPIDARPGHVPSAYSMPFANNLVAPGGAFRARSELDRLYRATGALDAPRVVAYCGSGVTACHTLLALSVLGRDDALLYEGSWSDWAANPALPAARGRER